MQFDSLAFLAFFPTFLLLYLCLQGRLRLQNGLILVGSYVFYGWWDWRFLLLISVTIVVDHALARRIAADPGGGRRFLVLSVCVNLGILAVFKYLGFFAESASRLLDVLGVEHGFVTLSIILPVGISFYTFQSMSYVVDVYRRQLRPCERLLDYAAYVSFFPQLVAGPIERGTRLLPQMLAPRRPTLERFYDGSYLILWGLFKKIFIADNLARTVDATFGGGGDFSNGAQVLVAVYAFAFQIYCDFSAYSDIARGLARILGFELMLNFNLPYLATNPAEFWHRWHISLSTWLRDYLYIPLGGSRGGTLRTCVNLMITMVLGGLWHGAQATFVVWGAYQGALLVAHRLFRRRFPARDPGPGARGTLVRAVKVVAFFQLVCIGWLVFRADELSHVGAALAAVFGDTHLAELPGEALRPLFYIAPLLAVQALQVVRGRLDAVLHLGVVPRAAFYVALVVSMAFLGNFDANEFIYFQF